METKALKIKNLAHFAKTFAFFAVKKIQPQRSQRIRKGRKKTKCMITCLFHVTKVAVTEKDFDTVKTFRAIKEKISKDISKMTLAQIKEYLKQQKVQAADRM
jgi:hypothetical protein